MNRNPYGWRLALVLAILVQLACETDTLVSGIGKIDCEARGGTWRQEVGSNGQVEEWCERSSTQVSPVDPGEPAEGLPGETQVLPFDMPTGEYLTPTPASAQDCDASSYIQIQSEVVSTTQEQYYRECEYKLSVTNTHPSDGLWVVRRMNTSVHSPALDSDNSYWYSDAIFPGQAWEDQFLSTYFTDGQFSREWVDMLAVVYDRPDCLYLLRSQNAEVIGRPVEWACGP